MHKRREGSSPKQFPENLIDPLVQGLFRALQAWIDRRVARTFSLLYGTADQTAAWLVSRSFFKAMRKRFSQRKQPKLT